VPLALRARSRGLGAREVAGALQEDRSIVRTWAMRGTLHLLTADDYHWIVTLTAETSLPGAHRRLAQLGVTGDQPARAVRAIERMLAADGPLTRAEIAERLARLGIRTEGQAAIHLIRLAALEGVLCYGPDGPGKPTFALVRDWLHSGRPRDRNSAPGELASRYLVAHGPAAPEDFASWSGLRAAVARAAWSQVSGTLQEVEAPGGSLWMLRSQRRAAAASAVRLVPAYDPYLLGWRTRQLSVPRRHQRDVFPGGGLLRPTVVADGLAVGTWAVSRRGSPSKLSIRPFSRLAPALRGAVAADAEEVGGFLDPEAGVSIEWDRPG
jgi:hypothetical protein